MAAKAWFCVLWSAIAALLFEPVYGADSNDRVPEPECEERKRTAMEGRGSGTTIDFIEALPKKWDRESATIDFMHIEFGHASVDDQTLTYDCESSERHGFFPAYAGFAWMILMPSKAGFSLVVHSSIDTTIRSYLEEELDAGADQIEALGVLVSGPFWKLGRGGEVPIGALVRGGVIEQDFRPNFSAKYVLCSTKNGSVHLLDGKVGMFEDDGRSQLPHEGHRGDLRRLSTSEDEAGCTAAIQVGPALFERWPDGRPRGEAKLGIGADSRNRSRRNVLIKVAVPNHEPGGRLILLSTLFDIASYDAMVVSELLVRKLSEEGTLNSEERIVWAVGLVDDESLSGPILTMTTMDGRQTLELSEVTRPTGAIMQFTVDGSEGEGER